MTAALLARPVATQLHLAGGSVVVGGRPGAAPLLVQLALAQQPASQARPPHDVPRPVRASLDHPLHRHVARRRPAGGRRGLAVRGHQRGGGFSGVAAAAGSDGSLLLGQLLLEEILLEGDGVLQVGGVGVHDVDVLGVDRLQRRLEGGRRRRGAVGRNADPVVAVPRPLTRPVTGADAGAPAARAVAALEVAVWRVLGPTRRRRRRLGR